MDTSVAFDASIRYNCPNITDGQNVDIELMKNIAFLEDRSLENVWKQIEESKDTFDQTRLLAEKLVLVSALKTKLFNDNCKQGIVAKQNHLFNMGSVTISTVKVRCFISAKVKQYFLCAVNTNSTLFVSQIYKPNAEGVLFFNINQSFSKMPTNFEISIKVYSLVVKKKDIRSKVNKLSCWFGIHPNSFIWRRESLFKLVEEKTISASDINWKKETFTNKIERNICITRIEASAEADISELFLMGWMDVSRDGLFWNQRWCVLQNGVLNFFYHPADENSLRTINLKLCISARVAERNEILRSKALVLEVDNEPHIPTVLYLSTDLKDEWSQWNILTRLIPTLRFWMKNHNFII